MRYELKNWGIYGQRIITDVLLFRQQRKAFLVSDRNRRWWAAKIEVVLWRKKARTLFEDPQVFRAYTLWGFLLRLCSIRLFYLIGLMTNVWIAWVIFSTYNQFADQKILLVPLKIIFTSRNLNISIDVWRFN